MGIDPDRWTGRIIDQHKGVVQLLPAAERARTLFGEDGAGAAADWIDSILGAGTQAALFPELETAPPSRNRRREGGAVIDGSFELRIGDATALDRVPAAMLLQARGHSNALRTLIASERDRGADSPRLVRVAVARSGCLTPCSRLCRGDGMELFVDRRQAGGNALPTDCRIPTGADAGPAGSTKPEKENPGRKS